MRITLENLISFYDEKVSEDSKHISSITGLIGEEIAAGVIKHFFERMGSACEILNETPTEGVRNGKWLDKWIKVDFQNQSTLFQTEIKNWSSHSLSGFGGRRLELHASEHTVIEYGRERFKEQWDFDKESFKHPFVNKVLTPMRVPKYVSHIDVEPLICFWFPILETSLNKLEAYYSIPCKGYFNVIHFFSLSIYLRLLNKENVKFIEIDMPCFEKRLTRIQSIFNPGSV